MQTIIKGKIHIIFIPERTAILVKEQDCLILPGVMMLTFSPPASRIILIIWILQCFFYSICNISRNPQNQPLDLPPVNPLQAECRENEPGWYFIVWVFPNSSYPTEYLIYITKEPLYQSGVIYITQVTLQRN
jgi:hypothetical protein